MLYRLKKPMLLGDEADDSQIAHLHVVFGCADAEPAGSVRLRVNHLEDLFAVAPVLDERSVGDEGDGLRFVGDDAFGGVLRDGDIVFG